MNKRIGLLVLAALCAVALGAIAASAASAKGITAFTCVKSASGPFSNEHCDSEAASDGTKDEHVAIPAGETTQLTATNIGSTELKAKIGVATVVLKASGVHCEGCHITNSAGPPMSVGGSGGVLTYTGVTINVASCKVKEEMVTTEPLVLTTAMAAEGNKFQATIAPVSGTTVAVLHLENNGAESCSLGSEIVVSGHATGTVAGATGKFATGAEELRIGTQKAELIGQVTVRGGLTPTEKEPNPVHNPIALTTTEP